MDPTPLYESCMVAFYRGAPAPSTSVVPTPLYCMCFSFALLCHSLIFLLTAFPPFFFCFSPGFSLFFSSFMVCVARRATRSAASDVSTSSLPPKAVAPELVFLNPLLSFLLLPLLSLSLFFPVAMSFSLVYKEMNHAWGYGLICYRGNHFQQLSVVIHKSKNCQNVMSIG